MDNKFNIEFTVQIWKEGSQYVAHAMPLDVMSCGETSEKAGKALDEAVHLFLATAAGMGTLDEVLEEAGYSHCDENWCGPSWVSFEKHSAAIGA